MTLILLNAERFIKSSLSRRQNQHLTMDLDKLLVDCVSLENTVSALIRNNASKQLELKELQNRLFEQTQAESNQLVDTENKLRDELEQEKLMRDTLETDIKQYTVINEKLNELVSSAQKINNEKKDNFDKNNELQSFITNVLQESEQLKQEFTRAIHEVACLEDELANDSSQVRELTNEGQSLVVHLHRNENILRVLDQQNKYAEQQFDLILNQVPWEPLTRQNINELLKSTNGRIRDLAAVLDVQTSDMYDLNESLKAKKRKKLEILEQLADQLNDFMKRRSQAILMNNQHDKFTK